MRNIEINALIHTMYDKIMCDAMFLQINLSLVEVTLLVGLFFVRAIHATTLCQSNADVSTSECLHSQAVAHEVFGQTAARERLHVSCMNE